MPLQIGQRPDHGFTEPLGLLSDCHRRIEHFSGQLIKVGLEMAARRKAGPKTVSHAGRRSPILRS